MGVRTVTVRIEQGIDREGVTKIMDAWPAPRCARHDASSTDQSLEGPLNPAVEKSSAGCRDEQSRSTYRGSLAISVGEVAT